MKMSESIKEISTALLKAQKEMGDAVKDSVNPYFKSSYADLNAIREACIPFLNKHGITVLQPTTTENGKNYVSTMLLHSSGEHIISNTEIIYSKEKDAQSQGSGITYARRYGLQSLMNVGVVDDDGNNASIQPVKEIEKPVLLKGTKFEKAKEFIANGGSIEDIKKKYKVTEEIEKLLTTK